MTDVLNFLILIFQGLYSIFADLLGFGWGLIALSVFSSFLFSPLEKWSSRLKNDEVVIQKVLQPQLQKIKETLSGQEAWAATQRLYNRYSYHPLMAIRTAAFPLLQLPVLFLAYTALSSMTSLKGISFGAVVDLSQPDNLIFNLALLPFLMTAINIAITFVGSFTKKERIQAVVIALFFLVLLYPAPAALLIYWTGNNFIGLIKATYRKYNKYKINLNCVNYIKQAPAWVWTLPLCPLVPALFLWANNVAYYTLQSVLISLTTILLCSFITWIFLFKLSKLYLLLNTTLKKYVSILYVFLIGFVFCTLSLATISYIAGEFRFYLFVALLLLLMALIKFLGFKFANYLLTFHIISFLLFFCYNFAKDQQYQLTIPEYSIDIELRDKPNIYYFLCESYQNLNYVKKVFNYDSSTFIRELKQHEYVVYDDIYSNSSYTLGTLVNVFSMNNQTSSTNNLLDISGKERNLIGGGKGNQLLKILKANGYETSMYFKGDTYFFSKKGSYLDNTDIPLKWNVYLQPLKQTNGLLAKLVDLLLESTNLKEPIEQDSLQIIKNHVLKAQKTKIPQFVFHRLFKTNHTDPYNYSYKQRKDFIASNFYQNGIAQGNIEINAIVEFLAEHDPNAIVIFMGDHGAWTYRGYNLGTDLFELNATLKRDNLHIDDIINDMFYIFCAIRLPDNVSTKFTNFSPANLFLKILNSLSNEEIPLKYFASNCIKLDPTGVNLLCRDDNHNWSKVTKQQLSGGKNVDNTYIFE